MRKLRKRITRTHRLSFPLLDGELSFLLFGFSTFNETWILSQFFALVYITPFLLLYETHTMLKDLSSPTFSETKQRTVNGNNIYIYIYIRINNYLELGEIVEELLLVEVNSREQKRWVFFHDWVWGREYLSKFCSLGFLRGFKATKFHPILYGLLFDCSLLFSFLIYFIG